MGRREGRIKRQIDEWADIEEKGKNRRSDRRMDELMDCRTAASGRSIFHPGQGYKSKLVKSSLKWFEEEKSYFC